MRDNAFEPIEPGATPANEIVVSDIPVPVTEDPGGAHSKGFSAEVGTDPNLPADGPLPLAKDDGKRGVIHQAERDGEAQPTGRSEPGFYNPNDRVVGPGG